MSPKYVSKSEFKAKMLEYFRQIEVSGESVIVTDHGKPALEVWPCRKEEHHPLDILRGSVVCYENPLQPVGECMWESMR